MGDKKNTARQDAFRAMISDTHQYCKRVLASDDLFAAMQITDTYKGSSFVVKRLRRQQIIGAVLLVAAGILMLVLHRNEWMVCLLVAAIFELYTAFRIPKELERDNQ